MKAVGVRVPGARGSAPSARPRSARGLRRIVLRRSNTYDEMFASETDYGAYLAMVRSRRPLSLRTGPYSPPHRR